jgi:hypothetical protein
MPSSRVTRYVVLVLILIVFLFLFLFLLLLVVILDQVVIVEMYYQVL